jgi:hypothetical protein
MDPFANTALAPSSRALFSKKLTQLASFMPKPNQQTIDYVIDNPEAAVKALKAQPTVKQTEANLHMFYSAAVAYLKHSDAGKKRSEPLKQRWERLQKENWETRRQQSLNNEPTAAQAEVATTLKWADIIKKREELPRGSDARLLLSLYTHLPPVRADYYEVKINPKPVPAAMTKANFLLLGPTAAESEIVLRDFKTSAKYKEIKHVLPEPLYEDIKAVGKRPYLFVMPSDPTRPYDRGAFSKWANKTLSNTFGIPMTLTTLRHLYVSTLDFNKTKASELEKIGNSMGHSISMQKGYQWL